MLKSLIARFSRNARQSVAHIDDIPVHAGFVATVYVGGIRVTERFKTLSQAQESIAQSRSDHVKLGAMLAAKGFTPRSVQRYTIRNLETGKFTKLRMV